MLPEPYRTIVARALAKDPNQRPGRVYDLLPPEDAPQDAGASGSSATARPAPVLPEAAFLDAPAGAAEEDDDVFRIEAEEPVFYIGPETRPPRPPVNQRLRAAFRRPGRPARRAARPARAAAG